MHKNPSNLQEVRDNLAEASYIAWHDSNFVNRAVVVVNAMGKMISSVALEIKAAEMSKSELNCSMLPPMKTAESSKKKLANQ